jgi:hypothetical protein
MAEQVLEYPVRGQRKIQGDATPRFGRDPRRGRSNIINVVSRKRSKLASQSPPELTSGIAPSGVTFECRNRLRFGGSGATAGGAHRGAPHIAQEDLAFLNKQNTSYRRCGIRCDNLKHVL